MSDNRPSRNTSSRRRQGKLPWMDPDAPRAWWSAPVRRARVVEHPPDPAYTPQNTPAREQRARVDAIIDAVPELEAPHAESFFATFVSAAREWLHELDVRRSLGDMLLRVALVVAAVGVLAFLVNLIAGLPWGGRPESVSQQTTSVHPTATHLPTATPTTPKQTELDGVIVITNLDPQSPFEGDVQVMAHDGAWYCRNAPLARSTWHVKLGPGASLSVPCVIPVAAPSSLPAHTFRRAVPSADGSGLALVDNPQPFQGSVFLPTAVPTP
ncbi:MAG TPA: hypothetical protein VGF38_01625 [Ktedonobacterales bacterium]